MLRLIERSNSPSLLAFGVLGAFVCITVLAGWGIVTHQFARAARQRAAPPIDRRTIIGGVLAVVLVTALFVPASAVRLTETRPIDESPEPIPDDPRLAYQTARENAVGTSGAVTIDDHHEDGGHPMEITEFQYDRQNRRALTVSAADDNESKQYESAGTATYDVYPLGLRGFFVPHQNHAGFGHVESQPGYWNVIASPGEFLPAPEGGEWRTVVERDGERVVAYEGLAGPRADSVTLEGTLDTERHVVETVEFRREANETMVDDPGRYERHETYYLEPDVTVERPAELDDPTPMEWGWKLLAY